MTAKLTPKQQFWLDHMRQADAAGQTLSQYANDTNLNIQLLYNWRKKLRGQGLLPAFSARGGSAPHFARVVCPLDVAVSTVTPLQLSIGTVTLRFDTLPDTAWLAQVIRTLESRQ